MLCSATPGGRNPEEHATEPELAYTRFEGGTVPIVVLHGLFGSKRNWKRLAERLSREAEADVYTVDLRHHGESPNTGPFNITEMAGDVCRFIDRVGLSPAFLLGHSVGGKVALQAALKCPWSAAGLILADISPFVLPRAVCDELRGIADALIGLPLEDIRSRREAEQFLLEKIPDLQIVRFLLQNLVKSGVLAIQSDAGTMEHSSAGPAYRWQIGLQAISEGLEEACRGVLSDAAKETGSVGEGSAGEGVSAGENSAEDSDTDPLETLPLLCIRGGASPFFPQEDVQRLRVLSPSLEDHTIPGAGHWLHVEQPDRFVALVGDFVRRR